MEAAVALAAKQPNRIHELLNHPKLAQREVRACARVPYNTRPRRTLSCTAHSTRSLDGWMDGRCTGQCAQDEPQEGHRCQDGDQGAQPPRPALLAARAHRNCTRHVSGGRGAARARTRAHKSRGRWAAQVHQSRPGEWRVTLTGESRSRLVRVGRRREKLCSSGVATVYGTVGRFTVYWVGAALCPVSV
jgi:hypothetical protein